MSGHIYFEIQADDLQRASDFYKELFGWTFRNLNGVPVEYWQGEFSGYGVQHVQTI